MKFISFLMVSIFLFGCSGNTNNTRYKPNHESLERERLANGILSKVAAKLKHEYRLIPCGSGGRTSNGVQMLGLSFFYRTPMEIEDGRELLIALVEEFVAAVNEDVLIRPYLKDYPFEPKNVAIRIFLQNSDDFDPFL